MVRKIFSPFWQFVGRRLLLSLSSISLRYRSQFAFFKLKLVRLGMGLIVRSIRKLMRIDRWSEPRFVFVCKLVEVIRGLVLMSHLGKMDWRCLVALLVNPNLEYRSWRQISYCPIVCISYLSSLSTTPSGVH